jgi:hypothetical protein
MIDNRHLFMLRRSLAAIANTRKWWCLLLVAGLVVACGNEETVSGIDGSGDKLPDYAGSDPSPTAKPIVAVGPINGFGSVIVYGDHYDTTHARFYRKGAEVDEQSFEVGDMVAVVGFEKDGKRYAEKVIFEPSVTGKVEAYDAMAGTVTILGQRIKLNASTVIGTSLNDKQLLGETLTISGWQGDSELRATRVEAEEDAQKARVKGHVHSIAAARFELKIGNLRINYAQVPSMPSYKEGDIVVFEGMPPEQLGGVFTAYQAFNYHQTLEGVALAADQIVLSGVVRNIESYSRFWVNGIEVSVGAQTQLDTKQLSKLNSGSLVLVRGTLIDNKRIQAASLDVLSADQVVNLSGHLEGVVSGNTVSGVNPYVVLGGQVLKILPTSALVDLADTHSRLGVADLRIGDYVVASYAVSSTGDHELVSLKLTEEGVNDRKFDGSDPRPYDWGFTPGFQVLSDPFENLLYSGPLQSVDLDQNILRLKNVAVKIRLIEGANTVAKSAAGAIAASDFAKAMQTRLDKGHLIWINVQGDLRDDKLWADKIFFRVDEAGELISGERGPLPVSVD